MRNFTDSERIAYVNRRSNVERFAQMPVFLFNDNLKCHEIRLEYLLTNEETNTFITEAFEQFGLKYDSTIAHYYASLSDFPEVFTGDIPTPEKNKMSESRRNDLNSRENFFARQFDGFLVSSEIESFRVSDIVRDAAEKEKPEFQVFSYVDKLDGMFCALHEYVILSNPSFLEPVQNYFSEIEKFHKGIFLTTTLLFYYNLVEDIDEPLFDISSIMRLKENPWNLEENFAYQKWLKAHNSGDRWDVFERTTGKRADVYLEGRAGRYRLLDHIS